MLKPNNKKTTNCFEYFVITVLILEFVSVITAYVLRYDTRIIGDDNTSNEIIESEEVIIDNTDRFEIIHISIVRGDQIKIFRDIYTDVLYLKIDQSVGVMYGDDGNILTYSEYKEETK